MNYVEWCSPMDMGIESLDQEHRQLVDILNRLYACWASCEGPDGAWPFLEEMEEYSLFHFRHEETMMAEAGYSALDEHIREHAVFIESVHEFKDKLKAEGCIVGDVLAYLSGWLINHILASDHHFSRFLKSKA